MKIYLSSLATSIFIITFVTIINHLSQSLTSGHQVTSKPIRNMETVDFQRPVFRVMADPDPAGDGAIYVGARNSIYKLSSNDLQKLDELVTGPVNDSIRCLPPPAECSYPRQLTDNDNRVLLFANANRTVILACGNVLQGWCQVAKANNFSLVTRFGLPSDPVNFVSGRDSVVAFIAPTGIDHHTTSLYSAASYDQRPVDYVPFQVASRILRLTKNKPGLVLTSNSPAALTQVNLHENYKQRFPVQYLYGFSHSGFSYFLMVQPMNPNSEVYETRLGRVCQADTQFFSYTEIPLECVPKKFVITGQQGDHLSQIRFDIATTAFLGRIGKRRYADLRIVDDEDDTLFVAMGQSLLGRSVNKTIGTAICGFPMQKLRKAFTTAIRNCFKNDHRSKLIEAFVGDDNQCTNFKATINDDFCGSGFNKYIEGAEPVNGTHLLTIQGHVTSLAVALQGFGDVSEAMAVVGTEDGNIMKLRLEDPFSQPLFKMNLYSSESNEDKTIRPDPAFDANRTNVYLLSGNQLVKFPFGSCSLHTDCSSCLGTFDPLNCGWCGSYCASPDECDHKTVINYNQCPPEIFEFSPKSGPTAGGTIITITGDNLGQSGNSEDNSKIRVTVAGVECHVFEWKHRLVKCRTQRIDKETHGNVTVYVKDLNWKDSRKYDINGTSTSNEDFHFLEPQLLGVNPSFGPTAGGTNVTVFGRNLHVGSQRLIMMGGVECKEIDRNQTFLSCTSGSYNSTGSQPNDDTSVKVFIDNVELIVNNNRTVEADEKHNHIDVSSSPTWSTDKESSSFSWSEYFQYKPNPTISDIHPKSTIASGNTSLTVVGSNLNSVAAPRMFIVATSTVTREEVRVTVDCRVAPNGQTMTCPTPRLPHDPIPRPKMRVPISTHVSFIMDGCVHLRNLHLTDEEMSRLIYYPDPVFFEFPDDRVRIAYDDDRLLFLDGKNLSDEYPVEILIDGLYPCNVTRIVELDSRIECQIAEDKELVKTDSREHWVKVSVGNLNFDVGFVRFERRPGSAMAAVVTVVVSLFVALVVLLMVAVFWLRKKGVLQKKMPNHVVHYNHQQSLDPGEPFQRQGSQNEYHGTCNQPLLSGHAAAAAAPSTYQVDEETMQMLREEHILIAKECVTLLYEIGQGHFGCVYKGIYEVVGKEDRREVAVKTINTSLTRTELDIDAVLQEGLMMKDFHHDNVLTLIGVSFNNDGYPMMIIPFMANGDLQSYIRNESNHPTVKDLLMFAIQVAGGMKYLSSLKFVHRDLAARNCMLSEDLTVKVADFGLSRDVYEREYYSSDNKKTKLPVRWMSPESLESGTYTTKSDVWSYGVLVWELLTRGVTPYPSVDNWDILNYLKSNRRMECPSHCPLEIYVVLLKCWSEDPNLRPSFSELVDEITTVINNLEERSRMMKVGTDFTYINLPIEPSYYNDIGAVKREVESLYAASRQPPEKPVRRAITRQEYETTC